MLAETLDEHRRSASPVHPVVPPQESTLPSNHDAPRQTAVIRQDGTVDHGSLHRFHQALIEEIPALDADAAEKPARLRGLLIGELGRMPVPAQPATGYTANQLLAIRDRYAAAARHARDLQNELRKTGRTRDAALFYGRLASALTELKRIHLTHAAPHIMQDYLAREVDNLFRLIPSMRSLSGSSMVASSSFGATYALGASRRLGPSARGLLTSDQTYLRDDDESYNWWDGRELAAEGGLTKGLVRSVLRLGARNGKDYLDAETMDDLVRLLVHAESNAAWIRSASPRTREAISLLQRISFAIQTRTLAQLYAPEAGRPRYLSSGKLSKGTGGAKLHFIGRQLDAQTGSSVFGELFSAAYPSTAARVRGEAGEGVYQEPLAATVPLSDPVGRAPFSFQNYTASASAGVGKRIKLAAAVDAGVEASAAATGNIASFRLRKQEPAHKFASGYFARMTDALKVQSYLESMAGDRRSASRLHLYGKMRDLLRGGTASAIAQEDVAYYGPLADIPEQYHAVIAVDDVDTLRDKLITIRQTCDELRNLYTEFIEDAAVVMARPDRFLVMEDHRRLRQERLAAFERINREFWGADEGGGYPGGAASALAHPEKFLAGSYDGISAALGCVGTHLAIAKRRLAHHASGLPDEAEKDTLRTEIQEADLAYSRTETFLGKAYLGVMKTDLYKEGMLDERGLSRWHYTAAQLAANVGFRINLGGFVQSSNGAHEPAPATAPTTTAGKVAGNAAAPAEPAGEISELSVTNRAGQLALTLSMRHRYGDYQINPSRQGHHLDFQLLFQAGEPVTGALIAQGLSKLLAKKRPELAASFRHSGIFEQLQGLAWDSMSNWNYVIRLRRYPGPGGAPHNHWNTQFIRAIEGKTSGIRTGVTIPLPVGALRPEASRQKIIQNVISEVYGPDLGYLILQHNKLSNFLRATESKRLELLGHGVAVSEGELLAAQFLGTAGQHPVWAQHLGGDMDARAVARSYFGMKTMIPEIISRYYRHLSNRDSDNGEETSEFDRFFGRNTPEEPFRDVARFAREATHFAPGSTAPLADKKTETRAPSLDPFDMPDSLLAPIDMPAFSDGADWDEVRTRIENCASVEDRIRYYCSEDGLMVLHLFEKIVGTVKEVHHASRHRVDEATYGFTTQPRRRAKAARPH